MPEKYWDIVELFENASPIQQKDVNFIEYFHTNRCRRSNSFKDVSPRGISKREKTFKILQFIVSSRFGLVWLLTYTTFNKKTRKVHIGELTPT